MSLTRVQTLLEQCSNGNRCFPPTILYNEGWMLRLAIDWFARNKIKNHPLAVPEGSTWYSEALLPSTFLPRYRGDKYSEAWTHADGVIGNIEIGQSGAGDLSIHSHAKHFVVLEAKMFSKLSSGTKNASYYNQAARNVACIAEVLRKGNIKPSELSCMGFYVLAPKSQIDDGIFDLLVKRDSVRDTVRRRITEYDKSKEDWWQNSFMPTLDKIDIQTISWEDIITKIKETNLSEGQELSNFYDICLQYNRPRDKAL